MGASGGASRTVQLAPTPDAPGVSVAPGASMPEAFLGNVSDSAPAIGTACVTTSVRRAPAGSTKETVVVWLVTLAISYVTVNVPLRRSRSDRVRASSSGVVDSPSSS